jgi:hypothetical protein
MNRRGCKLESVEKLPLRLRATWFGEGMTAVVDLDFVEQCEGSVS